MGCCHPGNVRELENIVECAVALTDRSSSGPRTSKSWSPTPWTAGGPLPAPRSGGCATARAGQGVEPAE